MMNFTHRKNKTEYYARVLESSEYVIVVGRSKVVLKCKWNCIEDRYQPRVKYSRLNAQYGK